MTLKQSSVEQSRDQERDGEEWRGGEGGEDG